MFNTLLFSNEYDVLVYSVLMNYTQDIFKHKEGGWCLAFGGYSNSADEVLNRIKINEDEKEEFLKSYVYSGQQNDRGFRDDLEWLIKIVGNRPVVFINGSEVPDFNSSEIGVCSRHTKMNAVLESVVESHNNCQILDIRQLVTKRSDCTNNSRHYQRAVYKKMAEGLMTILTGKIIKTSFYSNSLDVSRRLYFSIRSFLYHIKKVLN